MTPETFSAADIERIAALHVESIGDSIPTMLGGAYARAFFAYLATSPHEEVLTARLDGRIESVLVLSFEPATVYPRTLRATLPRLTLAATRALATSAAFRRFVVRFARDVVRGAAGQPHAPEITYAFTSPALRSTGLGSQLVGRAEQLLAHAGTPSLYVRTIDAPTNRAIGFYEANGFRIIGRQVEGGRPFVVFEKKIR